jgi:hypothetical protein
VALDGSRLLVASDLTRAGTIAALEEDGVWTVVRELAVKDAAGDVDWR